MAKIVSSGEIVSNTMVNYGGSMCISSGGVANSTTVNDGGKMYISSGGVADYTTVNSGAVMYISSGGTATNIGWNGIGSVVYYEDGATFSFADTISGVYFRDSSNPVKNNAIVHANTGPMYIMPGGIANYTSQSENSIYVYTGGIANYTSQSGRAASMYVYMGGIANSSVITGKMMIRSGGVVNDTKVNLGGSMVISGGVANSTTMSGGFMYISSGGVANSTTHLHYSGRMYISSGGVASNTTASCGHMFICSGGIANSTILKGGNDYGGGGSMYIASGGVANNTTMSGGYMYISSGGVANSTAVNSGGYMNISSGVANNTTVNSGASMYISFGGKANSTTLNSGGSMYIAFGGGVAGGVANSTTVNGGDMYISSGGVANSTTLNSGGEMYIVGNYYGGGVANNTTVNSGGMMYISSSGVANSTTLNSGGMMYISSGGTATDIVVAEGGRLGITVAPDTYIQWTSNGSAFEMKDATINGYTLNSGGDMRIFCGGVANSTMVNSGGDMNIASGGTALEIIENGGYVNIFSGAEVSFASNTFSGLELTEQRATVHSGTTAVDTILNSGGWMYIYSGGVANNTTVNSGGYMNITSGGTALEIIENGGYVYVADGAEVTFASNTFNGLELTAQSATVHSGTTATDITLNSGGKMYIHGDGVANNTTVNSGGSMNISSGGMINGNLEIADGGKVTVYEGGIIDFTVAEQKSADTALINDISRISGNSAVYTLTVSANQASGDYVLAGNAAAFDKTITVKTDEAELGKLTVGDNFTVGGVVYSLHLVDSNLTLTLDGPPELDVSLKQNISLDYEFEVKISEPASLQYKIDNGDWQDADGTTIAIAQNGTYSFRAEDLTGNMSEVVTKEISGLVFGNPEKVETDGGKTSWTPVKDAEGNILQVAVQYSMDNFKTVVTVVTTESALKLWSLPDNVQWRVKGKNDPEWEVGEEITAEKNVSAPQKIESVADGVTDIFFARTAGRWTILHQARHQGIKGGWTGTQETASLDGKSKVVDVFSGADDANVLYLTDGAKGDALFVDDIYADSFEGIAKTQARIANLDEIRAGAGDDVVDMTSQRFAYVGDGVTIYGGDGNDVIWSNKGDNKLFGDAGNDHIVGASGNDVIVGGAGDDTLHGGGGNDIFCFGSDWGIDTVDQLSGGTVTLWFEDGSEENWNADTRTYTDGENTVTVSGTADVTLKFGGDISSLPDGIFSNAVTKKIFESTLA